MQSFVNHGHGWNGLYGKVRFELCRINIHGNDLNAMLVTCMVEHDFG